MKKYLRFKKAFVLILVMLMLFVTETGLIAHAASKIGNVTGFAAAETRESAVVLEWNEVEFADGYKIYCYNAKNSAYKELTTVLDNEPCTIDGLTGGRVYTYYIKAYRWSGKKNVYSEKYAKLTFQTRCSPAKITQIQSLKKGEAEVTWSPNEKASYYQVQYSYNKKTWVTAGETTNDTITVKNLTKGEKVYFRVISYNFFEESSKPSEKKSVVIRKTNHSDYYVSGYSAEKISEYFAEVALDSEYGEKTATTNKVQKWTGTISYRLKGEYSKQDKKTVNGFFNYFTSIKGAPKVQIVNSVSKANLVIYFCDRATFNKKTKTILGYDRETSVGAASYDYYISTNNIYSGVIYICDEVAGKERTSVILEELYNAMGCCQDTEKRTDSIIYQYSNSNYALSAVDECIMGLLYNKEIKCGMNEKECAKVIKKLYY